MVACEIPVWNVLKVFGSNPDSFTFFDFCTSSIPQLQTSDTHTVLCRSLKNFRCLLKCKSCCIFEDIEVSVWCGVWTAFSLSSDGAEILRTNTVKHNGFLILKSRQLLFSRMNSFSHTCRV